MVKIRVEWYDILKGIGEGKTHDGKVVFLNSLNVESKGHFAALKKGETVSCELKKNDQNGFYAKKIVKLSDERKKFNKTTFLERRNPSRDSESSL